jgi:MFS family permease
MRQHGQQDWLAMITNRATHVTAAVFGVLVGLAGIDHGIFEILQGNSPTSGTMISAIGPQQRFWEYGLETAFTIVPTFLATGILAVVVGIVVAVWSALYLDRKHGALILMLLSVLLFLVGGGFAPIFMALIASLTASRIHKPLDWWRKILPGVLRKFLAKIWSGVLITFVVVFVISVGIAIFGWPLTELFDADTAFNYLNVLSYVMVGLMLLSSLSALAHDIQQRIANV